MDFLRIWHRAIKATGRAGYAYILVSGFLGAATTVLLTRVVEFDNGIAPDLQFLALFALTATLMVVTHGEVISILDAAGEGLAHHFRAEHIRYLRQSDLAALERLGTKQVSSNLARNAGVLAGVSPHLAIALTSVVRLGFVFLYFLHESVLAASVSLALTVPAAWIANRLRRNASVRFKAGQRVEKEFYTNLNQYLNGILEVKMDRKREADLFENFVMRCSKKLRDIRLGGLKDLAGVTMTLMGAFYLLAGTDLFILPRYLDDPDAVLMLAILAPSLWSNVEKFSGTLPVLGLGYAAYAELVEQQEELRSYQKPFPESGQPLPPLQILELSKIEYQYVSKGLGTCFQIGPCNMSLRPGQITFLSGWNGSGKTTLLKNLCSLYTPDAGELLWNGIPIAEDQILEYRERIAVIFSEFHLFDRVYGRQDWDPEVVAKMLQRVGLEEKTKFECGLFTTIDLSSGQKKRLALALALLDDRDIYIFDELASEQDPEFRQRIYLEFIPELKARNKTILLVTHDEKYFSTADQMYVMKKGQLQLQGA